MTTIRESLAAKRGGKTKVRRRDPQVSAGSASETPGGDGNERQAAIAEAAYYRSERRGFAPGYEIDDWLAAEAEVTDCSLLRDFRPESS